LFQEAISTVDAGTNPAKKEFQHHVPAPIRPASQPYDFRHCQLIHSFEQS